MKQKCTWIIINYCVLILVVFVTSSKSECFDLYLLKEDASTQEQLITVLTDPCRYDNNEGPSNFTEVQLQVDINYLENEQQTHFTSYMTVQYTYTDPRLAYKLLNPNFSLIYGEANFMKKIWIPHLIISNGKDSKRLGIDQNDIFITIDPDGTVTLSEQMTTTFNCWMNLFKFPFDTQICSLSWRSWANVQKLVLNWNESLAVSFTKQLHLSEFILDETVTLRRTVDGPFLDGPLAGKFSELVLEFHLSRTISYYILCYFLPSILLVCISWITFWLPADAAPARATLGASTGVAFITLSTNIVQNLPKYNGVKASDVWSLVISIFIYASLAEFAFANVIWHRKKHVELVRKEKKDIWLSALSPSTVRERVKNYKMDLNQNNYQQRSNNNSNFIVEVNGSCEGEETVELHVMTPPEVSTWVDRQARVIFPVLFLIFNCLYWICVYFA